MRNYYFKSLDDFLNSKLEDTSTWLLLIAENCKFIHDDLGKYKLSCYGGIFPEIIYDKEHLNDGLVAIELISKAILIQDMKSKIPQEINLNEVESMLVFVDGLSAHIDSYLFSLFEVIDEDCVLFGGGAGKLTLKQEKVIFSPDGIYEDASLIVPFDKKTKLGVSHGWKFLEGPLVATSSDKNILKKIDYEDAYEVYKKIVEADSGKKITQDNFFELSKSYPLGIVTMDNEVIVRDPILVQDNSLVLVGVMPENSVINILKGEKSHLIEAANKAAKEAYSSSDDTEIVFMIDCISRVLFLEDSFKQEIDSVLKTINNTPLVGALTLGEIANNSKSYIDFYNKTCVVGVLCSTNS